MANACKSAAKARASEVRGKAGPSANVQKAHSLMHLGYWTIIRDSLAARRCVVT